MEQRPSERLSAPVSSAPAAEKPPVTAAERWLLLGALAIGIAFRIFFDASENTAEWFWAFWGVALIVYLAFNRKAVLANRYACLLFGGTVAIMLLDALHHGQDTLAVLNALFVPCLLMLSLVFTQENPPVQREGVLLPAFFLGWFVKPFSAIPRAFSALGSLRKKRENTLPVLLGLVIGIPLLVIVLLLLSSADAGMEALLSGPLQDVSLDDVWRVLWTLLRICFTALLFYSLFDNALFGKRLTWKYRDAVWPPATLLVITGLLLLAYAAYGVVQFRYLFGGRLPEGATYSLYAREGFFQLITVMCINITLFGLTLRYAKPSRAGLVMQILLLVSTGLLLASAVIRLLLYISAYGLTMLRILPLWFMAYLAALLVLCAVRLKKTSLPLLRVGAMALLLWYVCLNIPNWASIILRYNTGL